MGLRRWPDFLDLPAGDDCPPLDHMARRGQPYLNLPWIYPEEIELVFFPDSGWTSDVITIRLVRAMYVPHPKD